MPSAKFRSGALFSSLSPHYQTPKATYALLNREFRFTDDPCPLGGKGGLLREWRGAVSVNPPYGSEVPKWIRKAIHEIVAGRSTVVVFLLPARTDTRWFHELVLPHAAQLRFVRGRLRFIKGAKSGSAPFPSCVIVFTPESVREGPLQGTALEAPPIDRWLSETRLPTKQGE